MADSKLADLTATTAPADTDLFYLVGDPAGTPVDRKITIGNVRATTHDVARMVIFGHSLPAGGGASDVDRDIMTHLASMMKVREIPRAVGGAILHWSQGGVVGDGGFNHVYQTEIRKNRASTTLSAQANSGSATISVTSGVGIANFDAIHVGTGDTGGTGGELLYVTAGGGTTTLTVQRLDGTATTARTHLSGEPVYVVPSQYENLNPFYIVWFGNNDIAASPISSATTSLKNRFMNPLRAVISRCRAAEIYEDNHKAHVFTGSWSLAIPSALGSGSTVSQPTAVNAAVTFHVPDNFTGGAICMEFIGGDNHTTEPVWTFTVDGNAAGTLNIHSNYTGKFNTHVQRITGLAAGRHKIVATITTLGAGACYFDSAWIESIHPPYVMVPGAVRPMRYTLWPSWPNSRRTTTLTLQANSGSNSFTVGTTTNMLVGATVTFEEGTGNAETLEVATVPTGVTFTTTTTTAITHAASSAVVFGMQDADMPKLNTNIQSVVAEFDSKVIYLDVDSVLNKNQAYFSYDGAHFDDDGHSVLVQTFFKALQNKFDLQTASYTSLPTAPLPVYINFTNNSGSAAGANTQWTNMPAALTELFGVSAHRKHVDMRRVFEARFVVGVQVAGFAGSSLRIRYSIDGGTTWKYLFRTAQYAEDTTHEAILTSTGMKDSGWRPIAVEAIADNVLLSVWGINGNAAVDPTFGTVDLWLR